ncbi:MAG: hypothetical protein JWN98_709 [Abditibacteriota bacterium]|nr:hypothetical protein [Abditibacteriota bacterium]
MAGSDAMYSQSRAHLQVLSGISTPYCHGGGGCVSIVRHAILNLCSAAARGGLRERYSMRGKKLLALITLSSLALWLCIAGLNVMQVQVPRTSSRLRKAPTPKPTLNPSIQRFISATERIDSDTIFIPIRETAGGRNEDAKYSILMLSRELSACPKAKKFVVSWSRTVASGFDEFSLIDDRRRKTLTYIG